MKSSSAKMLRPSRIGVVPYDLQPFTEDCLFRVQQAVPSVCITAYPVIHHPHQARARIGYEPSMCKGRYFGVTVAGSTPEGFASNVNIRAALRCALGNDVIVLFGLQGGTALFTALVGKLLRRTIVSVNQTLPVEWERKRRWWVKALKRLLLRACAVNVYQTPAARDVLLQVYGVPEASLVSAPFEAGASLFVPLLKAAQDRRAETRGALRISTESLFILFVGNLHPFKGVFVLLEALARVPPDIPVVCVFAGPEEPRNAVGGTIKSYMSEAIRLGISHRVVFTGTVPPPRLAQLYAASDVVVLPTEKDCFPKALVEGALAGKPLITTSANGAAGSLVVDRVNGYIIEPSNISQLAERLAALLPVERRLEMGRKSLEIVSGLCDLERETVGFKEAIVRALAMAHD